MSGLREAFDRIVADVPEYGDLDRAIERAEGDRRRRVGVVASLSATAAALVVVAGILAVTRDDDAAPDPAEPTPTSTQDPIDPNEVREPLAREPSEVVAARQHGRYRLEIAGKVVPGRWSLEQSRRDVWVATYFDEVGYGSPALWWGRGTTTHEVPGVRGGVAISEDAHWIVWTRSTAGGYDGVPSSPRAMEVVDTATGKVRWSRDAEADAPDIGALAVTNDGVVMFGHCLKPVVDIIGTPQCDAARVDVWSPRSGAIATVPADVHVDHGPPGTVAALTPLVQVDGVPHNGLLVRDTPSGRPTYVRVTARGQVEVVATLPRNTVAVTADERFALLSNGCPGRSGLVCRWSVLPLDGGEPRRIDAPEQTVTIGDAYDWPVHPYVVEQDDLVVIRDLADYKGSYPAIARCSLAQARCVRINQ